MAEENGDYTWGETAPVCPECRKGAMLPEVYAKAKQSDDGTRVAVVKNVPRKRCAVCGHWDLDVPTAVRLGSLLGSVLDRYDLAVLDWNNLEVSGG